MAAMKTDALAAFTADPFSAIGGGYGEAGIGLDGFQPLHVDVSPLQKFLIALAKQVEQLQKDNASLRDEIAGLKINKRLESLESGMQELAENLRPATGYNTGQQGPGFPMQDPNGQAAGSGGISAASDSWVIQEFTTVKDRIGTIERRAEALWHVKEDGQEIRALMDRLKTDVEGVSGVIADTQGAARHAQAMVEKLEAGGAVTREQLEGIVEKVTRLEMLEKKGMEDRREAASKLEAHVNSIWDQIRHVENSLSQRLTLAETSQVSTLQEVDDMKEAAAEVGARLDEARRHVVALESKLESFNTQVAAAITPLHNSLAAVQLRLDELESKKQDKEAALTVEDVNAGVARAIDHADRRADNIIKSIGAMEERVEELNDAKANRADVVLAVDLDALLAAHADALDGRLAGLRGDMVKALGLKADREEVAALEGRQGARLASLEGAILKGLKAISDRVSAALAEKLDLTLFNEFKVQVRAILADVEDRLRDWSPAARGMKAPLDGSGATGATSCLCCDQRVRSVRDLQAMGFPNTDRVFAPEALPATEPLLPAIHRSPDMAAHNNARLAARKKDVAAQLRASAAPVLESLPSAVPGT
eukprot:CAMPEP_0202877566 /NCGR_PEP_ID=MMETSP1391-20130828/30868_1 /ASSEMBLY_ACC=CAM_ASM_000867 /TAXON_ID=1034604 /ORGANISM="Chlamydomonas leiostraca, Strain SAG 11-49" /LENGTH=594 /DNA_ID=CAMNT_0049559623 /DNA_START=91 /DNA_END=1871 /DNA_ORIENTATION=+